MTNNLINGGGTSGACRISVSSVLLVIVLLCIQVRYFDIELEKCVRAVYLISSIEMAVGTLLTLLIILNFIWHYTR